MSPGELQLPCSQACENNKAFILSQLQDHFANCQEVLELGSGTGQHATWFARFMPWLRWQPTDVEANLSTLKLRCDAYRGDNLRTAIALDVSSDPWVVAVPDAVFSANSLHIMPFSAVVTMFAALGKHSRPGTVLAVYGPFNYGGQYSSESNARFDIWLAQQHPDSAIRDFEKVDELARRSGFVPVADHDMPANNRLLVWRKSP